MESYLTSGHFDLVTPDGAITKIETISERKKRAFVTIHGISPFFVGFDIDQDQITFNLKSTLAQIGIHAQKKALSLDIPQKVAHVELELISFGPVGKAMLDLLPIGAYIGKLFAKDERRKVRDPNYLTRLFGRSDREGRPLLSLGNFEGSRELILEKIDGRTIAFLAVKDGALLYDSHIYGFLPTLAKALTRKDLHTRKLLSLHQFFEKNAPRIVQDNELLLLKTAPLHIRTVYGRVVDSLLPKGYNHTSANILQPDTFESGDIYEVFGSSHQVIDDIPIEFFTLEPHREHVFFADRDQLQASLEDPEVVFQAFESAPGKMNDLAAIFVVKGTQLKTLQEKDWIQREPLKYDFPGLSSPTRQAMLAEKYIEHQPAYPFLKGIEDGLITSEGVLFSRHFPSPLLKRMLLSDFAEKSLKRIYFQYPSCSHDGYFSHEDRAFLVDLAKFGIPVFWVDSASKKILQYVLRPETDSGLFVPLNLVETFRKATFLGIYGSNLIEGSFEEEIKELLTGLEEMKKELSHPLLSKNTPLALLTGGGPGVMEMGNRAAKAVGVLSCANIVDFRTKEKSVVNEQRQNPYIDAKMTYRLDRLVERQAEFYLDLPIFLPGGIGMDFEYALEEVRRKTGACPPNPVLLFGEPEYWKRKIQSRFQLNQETGTIRGSEWVSNCFYCVQNAKQALSIYRKFFENKLAIGKDGPIYIDGFSL